MSAALRCDDVSDGTEHKDDEGAIGAMAVNFMHAKREMGLTFS